MSRIDQALELVVGRCEPALDEQGGYKLGKQETVLPQA